MFCQKARRMVWKCTSAKQRSGKTEFRHTGVYIANVCVYVCAYIANMCVCIFMLEDERGEPVTNCGQPPPPHLFFSSTSTRRTCLLFFIFGHKSNGRIVFVTISHSNSAYASDCRRTIICMCVFVYLWRDLKKWPIFFLNTFVWKGEKCFCLFSINKQAAKLLHKMLIYSLPLKMYLPNFDYTQI